MQQSIKFTLKKKSLFTPLNSSFKSVINNMNRSIIGIICVIP
jgi:hypothetical protein